MEETRHSLLGYLAIDRLRASHEVLQDRITRLQKIASSSEAADCATTCRKLATDVASSARKAETRRSDQGEKGSVTIALESSSQVLIEAAEILAQDVDSAALLLQKSHSLIEQALDAARTPDRTWDALFKLYPPLVHRWLSSWPSTQNIPRIQYDDIASEVMIAFLAALPSWNRERSGGTRKWLKKVAHNKAMDYFRTQKKHGGASLEDFDAVAPGVTDDSEDQFYADRYTRAIKKLLTGPDLEIVTHFLAGMKQVQIAEQLGLSEGAVKNRWMRLKSRLRKELGDLPDSL